MGVRLNKVLTELNIGLQTAVDYLKNKKSLGVIKDDANMNTKISDEQYEALVLEFKGNVDIKTQAGMMFPKKREKIKKENKPNSVAMEVTKEPRQTYTPLGKIDLNQVGKPASKEKEEPQQTFTPLGKIDLDSLSHNRKTESLPIEIGKKNVTFNADKRYDIFVSYSRIDTNKVQTVVKELENKGYRIWIDRKGINSGDAFKAVIVKAIKNSEVFLFFSSKGANESPWTIKEVDLAVYLKKVIIPIKLDNTDYNDSVLFDLVGLDYVDFTDKSKHACAISKLTTALKKKIAHSVNNT